MKLTGPFFVLFCYISLKGTLTVKMRVAVAFILLLSIAMTLSAPGKERHGFGEDQFEQTEQNDQGNKVTIN